MRCVNKFPYQAKTAYYTISAGGRLARSTDFIGKLFSYSLLRRCSGEAGARIRPDKFKK